MLARLLLFWRRCPEPPAQVRAARKILALGMRDTTALCLRRLG